MKREHVTVDGIMPIEAVVFDMDGVLCRYNRERRLALLASWSGKSAEEIDRSVFRSGFEDEAERGALSAEEYLQGMADRLGYQLTAEQWVEARRSGIEPAVHVLSIARRLSDRLCIAMFTNNPWLLKRHFSEVFPEAAQLFGDRAIFSAQLGCCKPEPKAFRALAARLGYQPEELLFFDDWPSYVAGASSAGLNGWHARGAEDVRAGLQAHGLNY